MHLQVNQRLQEVASYKRDKFFPQEIDLALNKAMFRLLEKAALNKFEDTQMNLSHISALIKKNKIAEVIIPGITDPVYDEHSLLVYTPIVPDLFWTVNLRAEVITDPLECDTAPTLATTNLVEYVVPLALPPTGAAPYYSNMLITSSTLGTLYTAPSGISAGFSSTNSKYVVANNIQEYLHRASNVKVYWERYRGTVYPGKLIFVFLVPPGVVAITAGGQISNGTATATTYTTYNRALISAITSKEVDVAPVSIIEDDVIYNAQKHNSFYATGVDEPNATQNTDFFIVYRDESFLVTRLYYDYIRKPRTISLALAQDCELAETAHPRIIDLAVEILRLDTKDESYQLTAQDTEIRTN